MKMNKAKKLEQLKDKALKDDSLPLKSSANNLVFGVGNPNAQILFVGEGPGYWEDIKAEPFVGNAGALLNQLLTEIGMDRNEVYITNVLMYRPPNNRDPQPSEIKAFEPYLDGIINTVNPKLIVTLGRFSMGKFIPGVYISSIHGKVREVEWKGRKLAVLPMYHPAAALRNGEVKEKFKRDFYSLPEIVKNLSVTSEKNDDNIGKRKSQTEQRPLF